jgi:hypothetical protein
MFYGLTNRKSEPDSTGGAPNGFRRLADTWAQALASIKAARPSIAAERREQESTQFHPLSPEPDHKDPFIAQPRQEEAYGGRLGGQGSGHQANTPVQRTMPGPTGRVSTPSTTYARQPLSIYAPPSYQFPKTLDGDFGGHTVGERGPEMPVRRGSREPS